MLVVKSPSISLAIEESPMAYVLTITVDKTTGVVGDTFQFVGVLGYDSEPVIGERINLVLEGVGVVGTTTTRTSPIPGYYSISWVADRAGALTFHTEAPDVGAVSGELALGISYSTLLQMAGPLVAGAAMILLSRS